MCSRSLARRTPRIRSAGYATPFASILAAMLRLSAVTPVIMSTVMRRVSRLVRAPRRASARRRPATAAGGPSAATRATSG